ncbi:helix-turn-helix domain-containing protein [Alicyclobacillus macrosporangiidus]|uniref:helix-turn-helix domain-containing protein n=1 Tax=Alicyclobacillus macrosporangiidus TaxID=392015 RepID=UPI000557C27C|nr:helix-turn-helix transcriptional regulator [Alicyclobacillus macrosporangiidus]
MFGKRLRYLRQQKHLTMKELGQIFGLAESTISGYENGIRSPDIELLPKFADFFGVSVDYLLGRTDDPHGSTPVGEDISFEEKEFLRWVREHVTGVFFAEFDEAPEESKAAVMETLRWYWENIEKPRMKKNKGSNQ